MSNVIEPYVRNANPIAIYPIVVGPLMRQTVSLCVAMPGVGKSTWAQAAAVAIAHERPDIVSETQHTTPLFPGHVVLCFSEDRKNVVRKKFTLLEDHYALGAPKHGIGTYSMSGKKLFRLGPNSAVEFIGHEFVEGLIALRAQHDIGLIVIDTLSACLGGINESNPEQMQIVMDHFIEIARNGDCSVLLIHHANKVSANANQSMTLYAGRGSSVVPASVRSVFTLSKLSKAEITAALKARASPADLRAFVKVETVKASYSDPTTWQTRWFRMRGVDVPAVDKRDQSQHTMSMAMLEPLKSPPAWLALPAPPNDAPGTAFGGVITLETAWDLLRAALRKGLTVVHKKLTHPRAPTSETNAKDLFGVEWKVADAVLRELQAEGMISISAGREHHIAALVMLDLPEKAEVEEAEEDEN